MQKDIPKIRLCECGTVMTETGVSFGALPDPDQAISYRAGYDLECVACGKKRTITVIVDKNGQVTHEGYS